MSGTPRVLYGVSDYRRRKYFTTRPAKATGFRCGQSLDWRWLWILHDTRSIRSKQIDNGVSDIRRSKAKRLGRGASDREPFRPAREKEKRIQNEYSTLFRFFLFQKKEVLNTHGTLYEQDIQTS
jgi:hypothetical protein